MDTTLTKVEMASRASAVAKKREAARKVDVSDAEKIRLIAKATTKVTFHYLVGSLEDEEGRRVSDGLLLTLERFINEELSHRSAMWDGSPYPASLYILSPEKKQASLLYRNCYYIFHLETVEGLW